MLYAFRGDVCQCLHFGSEILKFDSDQILYFLFNVKQDCVTLRMIEHNLEESVSLHGEMCQSHGRFGVVNQLGMDNLLLTCDVRVSFRVIGDNYVEGESGDLYEKILI